MENTNENFSKIRKVMDEMRIEKYEINNPQLAAMDEYTKTLYLKILCTVVQYDNNSSEMQIEYLKRIVEGMKVDETIEEVMKKGLGISETDIQEFVNIMRENEIRYYFALEAILLIQMGNAGKNNYEYIAELIDLCNITKNELKCLTFVVKSVLEQNSDYFENAKEIMPDSMEQVSWMPYMENYYAGAIMDNKIEKYYTAPDVSILEGVDLPIIFNEEKVTFHNNIINLREMMYFKGCREIVFQNCKFIGEKAKLKINNAGSVRFENCSFSQFKNRVVEISNTNEMIVRNCKFNECGYLSEKADERGGILLISTDIGWKNTFEMSSVILENNQLHNCYIKAERERYNYGVTGVFIGIQYDNVRIKNMVVENNIFSGCECINNGNYSEAMIGILGRKIDDMVNQNNYATGKLVRIIEGE